MRAIDQPGLCQFAMKGLDWQDLSGGALDVAIYYIYIWFEKIFSLIHGAILIPSVWPVLTPGA